MAVSPEHDAAGVIRVAVACDGRALDAPPLMPVVVRHAASYLPSATLELDYSDITVGTFELADVRSCRPGAEGCAQVGYGNSGSPIFKGIVTRLGVRINGANALRPVVECQDRAETLEFLIRQLPFRGRAYHHAR